MKMLRRGGWGCEDARALPPCVLLSRAGWGGGEGEVSLLWLLSYIGGIF